MDLIRDWYNGGKWQWRYFDSVIGRFFDYGPAFASERLARDWLNNTQQIRQ